MQVLPLELGFNNNAQVENRKRKMNASYFNRFRDLQFQRKAQNVSQVRKLQLLTASGTTEQRELTL